MLPRGTSLSFLLITSIASGETNFGSVPTLSIDPINPTDSFVNVTVTWTNVVNAKSDDWIGIFCPWENVSTGYTTFIEVGTGLPNGQPFKYGPYIPFTNGSALTWREGYGSVSFMLPNIRCKYDFVYYQRRASSNGTTTNTAVTMAPHSLQFPTAQPLGIHLAYTGLISEMRVNWNSDTDSRPIATYRAKGVNTWQHTTVGTTTTYAAEDLCGSEATVASPSNFINPGYFHSAVMTGLKPNTVYEYQVAEGTFAPSSVFEFRSAPSPSDPVAFLMWADMGTDQYNNLEHFGNVNNALKLIQQVVHHEAIPNSFNSSDNRIPIGLVTHIGDLSYGCGSGFIWEQWMSLIEPVAAKVPYMIAVGNHEYDHEENCTKPGMDGVDISGVQGPSFHPDWGDYRDDSYGECGVPTAKRFTMPKKSGSNLVFWYSYDYGPIHFTVFSAEHNFTNGSRQHAWITKDIASVDRKKTPWLIVQMHRPMYASEGADGPEDKHLTVADHLRDSLEDAFVEAEVDLVMNGHLHSYERTCSVLANGTECNAKKGIVNLRVGTAGGTSDNCKAADPLCPNNDTMSFMSNTSWREIGLYEYGYSRVTLPNTSALHIEFVLNNNTIKDEAWLFK